MEFLADGLLIATAMTAGLYCLVLSRRLRALSESGGGIGAQIESLDEALAETRSALAETRDGVGELRASAKATLAQLARESKAAAELADRVETVVFRAEATMQRLYQAESRLEGYLEPSGEEAVTVRAETGADGAAPEDAADGDEPRTGRGLGHGDDAGSVRRVALPSGVALDPDPAEDISPAGLEQTDSPRVAGGGGKRGRGGVLKAERMML